jgi:hypothetical protein
MGELVLDEVVVGDEVPYLDTLVKLTIKGIEVEPYSKPSTTFLYTPPFTMHHPSSVMAWPANELKRILLLSSNRDVYTKKICEFLYHLKLRGYKTSHLKRLRGKVIHHRYRREILWEESRNKSNPFPIVIPFCEEIGTYNPRKIMELAKQRAKITNPMVK